MEDMEKYLQPSKFFDFDKERVRRKAEKIVEGSKTDKEKAIALFYFVRDEIKYNMMTYLPKYPSNFKASTTLRRGNGFCLSKGILLATLARAVGIPARVHVVDIINHKISQKVVDLMGTNAFYGHGYGELYIDGKWLKLSPNFDQKSALKGGFLPMTEFDGENDALFPHHDEDGNLFVEYIGDRGSQIDIDLGELEIVFNEKYPKWYRDLNSIKKIKRIKKDPLTLNK